MGSGLDGLDFVAVAVNRGTLRAGVHPACLPRRSRSPDASRRAAAIPDYPAAFPRPWPMRPWPPPDPPRTWIRRRSTAKSQGHAAPVAAVAPAFDVQIYSFFRWPAPVPDL